MMSPYYEEFEIIIIFKKKFMFSSVFIFSFVYKIIPTRASHSELLTERKSKQVYSETELKTEINHVKCCIFGL